MATTTMEDPVKRLSRGALASGTDLNTITAVGVYLLSGSNTYTNAPATYGILEVLCPYTDSTNLMMQRLTTTSAMYFRYRSGGSWYAWKTVAAS